MVASAYYLGLYLGLLNIPIPGVYGPNADEMLAWLKNRTAQDLGYAQFLKYF